MPDLSPTAQFMLNAAFHQHQQHDHLNPTTDFRALLADDAYAASFQSMGQYRTALLKALATPPPEPPTDDELMALAVAVFEDPYATDKDYARAVLERWGK